MNARLHRVLTTLDEHLHGAEDRRAKARGWKIHRTGWLGLGRTYTDPRWSSRPAAPTTVTD